MYYSSGNYEAFARPRKPEGVERKSAWLVGSGLASLAAACFLVRDGQMKGENIHILEELKLPGGACDGIQDLEEPLLPGVPVPLSLQQALGVGGVDPLQQGVDILKVVVKGLAVDFTIGDNVYDCDFIQRLLGQQFFQ